MNGNTISNTDHLDEFITRSKVRLKALLERLQWTEQDICKNFNTNTTAALHEKVAAEEENKSTGIDEEPPLPVSCANKNTVVLAENELRKLLNDASAEIPKRFSDLQVNFTCEQKLQIYQYVVECTGKCTEKESIVPALNEGQMTFADIVAMKKREKKNRRRHRTSKPTHIEEVRGLVELQMQAMQQYLETKANEDKNLRYEKDRSSKRSRSRDTQRRYNGHHRKRSRSNERVQYKRKRSRSRSRSSHRKEYKRRSRSGHRKDHKKRSSRSRSRSGQRKDYKKRSSRSRSRQRKDYKKRSRSHSRHRDRSPRNGHYRRNSRSRDRSRSSTRHKYHQNAYKNSTRDRRSHSGDIQKHKYVAAKEHRR